LSAFGGKVAGKHQKNNNTNIVRVSGSYNNPIDEEQRRNVITQQRNQIQTLNKSLSQDEAVPDLDDDAEIVEFVSAVDENGIRRRYWGAAHAPDFEEPIHESAKEFEESIKSSYDTFTVEPQTTAGDDWEVISIDQGENSIDGGTIKHNMEWRRWVRSEDEGYNAFKSNVASIDDTALGWTRDINVEHRSAIPQPGWREMFIHDAGPTSSSGGSVSIGVSPTGPTLSWTTPINEVSHEIDNSLSNSENALWTEELPSGGDTHWFKPGTTFVSESVTESYSNKKLFANLNAEVTWGGFKNSSVSFDWNLYTYGSW
jgi:hypothetical protein